MKFRTNRKAFERQKPTRTNEINLKWGLAQNIY